MTLKTAIASVVLATACITATNAQAAIRHDVDIPAQELGSALVVLAKQARIQVVYSADLVRGHSTQDLSGSMTPDEALDKLLAKTGLKYEFLDEQTVTLSTSPSKREQTSSTGISPGSSGKGPAGDQSSQNGPWNRLRLAQAESSAVSSQQRTAQDVTRTAEIQRIDEIVVAGSRLKRHADGTAAPLTVFDRKRIDELGVPSVSDVLNYLPQQTATDISNGRNAGGAVFAQLRGIGADASLVLINGRRAVPSGPSVQFNAVDLNAIPLAAVERIEILSDSASAVYGADALGGVINIVLKRDVPRAAVDVRYGAASGGAVERRATFSTGLTTDRLRASVVVDYFDRDTLLGAERELWADQDYRRFGSVDRRSASSNPGNVRSLSAANLPGLPSRTAAVPVGSTGVGLVPQDFVSTAGQQNLDSLNRFKSIVPETERRSAFAFGEFDLTSQVSVFGEALYVDRTNSALRAPSSTTATVPVANSFNPFGVPVSVSYLFEGVGAIEDIDEGESYRAVLGIKGQHDAWDWEFSVLDTDDRGRSWSANAVDIARANAALSATDPVMALNVFQDGPGGSDELLRSLIAAPVVRRQSFDAAQASAFVRGALFALPGGDVDIVVGAEARQETMQAVSGSSFSADRDVSAFFSELRLPLVSADMGIPLATTVSLTVAARYDDYSDFGSTVNPQYSLDWQPFEALSLRTTYGTGFRAPSLFELHWPSTSVPGLAVVDPRRGETARVTWILGGNQDLEPIEGDSWTAGFVLQPTTQLRLSANYWEIELDQRVSIIQPGALVAYEDMFPERVQRAAPTAADVAAGRPGELLRVISTYQNFGRLKTSGVDASGSYEMDTRFGRFSPRISATWVEEYSSFNVPGLPMEDRVGIANQLSGTVPEWRAVASLGWSLSGFGLSASARYVSGYEDVNSANIRTGNRIPSQILVDTQATLRLDEVALLSPWLNAVTISVGVSNLLDREPTFTESGGLSGYDSSQGDLRGRFVYAAISKSF